MRSRSCAISLWCGFLALCLVIADAGRAGAQDLRDSGFMAQAKPGFDDILNLDYAKAEQLFLALKEHYPHHPAPSLYLATIIWLRELIRRQDLDLDRFAAPGYFTLRTKYVMPAEQRSAFLQHLSQSEALARRILANKPTDKDGRYFLAANHGVRAAFSITIDHSLRNAFSYGKRAYQLDRQLVNEDPAYYDAYMTVGLYEYVVGSLPWYVKWMATLAGYQGTQERGFSYLNTAAQKGQYVTDEAKVLLMVLFVRQQRYVDALAIAEALHRQFPRNYLFHLNVAQVLEKMGKVDQAMEQYQEVLRRAENGLPNYDQLPQGDFRYQWANKLFAVDRRHDARQQYERVIQDSSASERDKALSRLRLGELLDLDGKRGEAIQQYQAVLALQEFDNSHKDARALLSGPFRRPGGP